MKYKQNIFYRQHRAEKIEILTDNTYEVTCNATITFKIPILEKDSPKSPKEKEELPKQENGESEVKPTEQSENESKNESESTKSGKSE